MRARQPPRLINFIGSALEAHSGEHGHTHRQPAERDAGPGQNQPEIGQLMGQQLSLVVPAQQKPRSNTLAQMPESYAVREIETRVSPTTPIRQADANYIASQTNRIIQEGNQQRITIQMRQTEAWLTSSESRDGKRPIT